MFTKFLGAFSVILGLAILFFAVITYLELKSLERSGTPRSDDSMPLTMIVGPEMFDNRYMGVKPSILAKTIFNRIYVIGGTAIVFAVLGAFMLAAPKSEGNSRTGHGKSPFDDVDNKAVNPSGGSGRF